MSYKECASVDDPREGRKQSDRRKKREECVDIKREHRTSAGERLLYSGKLSREKTFANFVVLWLLAKVFSVKFGAWHSLARHKQAIHESFLCENRIFFQSAKVFSLESFPLYGNSCPVCKMFITGAGIPTND